MTPTPSESGPPPTGPISALKPQSSGRERLNVYVGGRFAFALDAQVAMEAGLAVGREIDEAFYDTLLAREELAKARTRALRFLEARSRSRREVRDRLRRYGCEPPVIDATLDWLEQRGFVDDARYAVAYVTEKTRAGWGPRRIGSELAARGVDRQTAAAALAELDEAASEEAQEELSAVVRRRFARDVAADPRRGRERARAFLLRRGHEWSSAERLIQAAFGGAEPDEADS